MPQLAEVFADLLDGAVTALAKSEAKHLETHVKAIESLSGKEPGVEDLIRLFNEGWLPDHFAAAELDIDAQLAMATQRERKITAAGGLEFGPVKLEGGLANSFLQGTQTNLAVRCSLRRQSRSAGLEYALNALSPTDTPPLPSG